MQNYHRSAPTGQSLSCAKLIIVITAAPRAVYFCPKHQTMNNRINISHVTNTHNQWLRSLNFYKTEISILKSILTEIARKNTGGEAMKETEHFENQFYIQSNNIDALAHAIHGNISAIADAAKASSAGYIDAELKKTHDELGIKTEQQETTVTELVRSFRRFAEKWM